VSDWRVPGFTSTGSKRPDALFGSEGAESEAPPVPDRMVRAAGCRVWDAAGREYVDYVMALGAVALGYGHPAVNRAASDAVANGVVGPLPPVIEEELAEALCDAIPWIEAVRFLKSGAEAVAAAVRLGRVATGRDRVLGCGYHGWLDWCQGGAGDGVPAAIRALYAELPFNDVDRTRAAIRAAGDQLAVVVVEPLIVAEPTRDWLETLRAETTRVGAVLVFDEIKTAFRLAVGGAAERYGVQPDLMVLGKALANGFPLAAVGGRAEVMRGVTRTWISSTLATESVALAAARATLEVTIGEGVCAHLHRVGTQLLHGLHSLQRRYQNVVTGVGGVAEMCFLHYIGETQSRAVARGCAARGLLFKRTAYNFVSLAHDASTVDRGLAVLEEVLDEVAR
jgi:glutamate-1-semialdehyde 2,1-aminomutase